ncbi:MAG: electron transfer flavoprotein subunit beta/FixA family protein [Flavobacteriales bacterium]
MNVLVCISQVPDTTAKIEFTDGNRAFDTTGISFVINPYDEFGLTRAIWLQERQGARITAVTVGDASVEPSLRKALALGADDAIRIDAEPRDSYQVANELAALVEAGKYDLVITGKESIDYNGGAVPGFLAAMLNWPFVNGCIQLEIEGRKASAQREIDGGREVVGFPLPAVIAGQKGLVEERDLKIPSMRGIVMARKKPLTVKEPLGTQAKTQAEGFERPASKSAVTLIDADRLDELIKCLHEEVKVI